MRCPNLQFLRISSVYYDLMLCLVLRLFYVCMLLLLLIGDVQCTLFRGVDMLHVNVYMSCVYTGRSTRLFQLQCAECSLLFI